MPLRDINEDRDVRPSALLLGHIRLGFFDKGHPQQSEAYVFTSSDRQRLEPLARVHGGTIERYTPQGMGEEHWRLISETDAFTALFPFADFDQNLSQDWTLYGRAGLKRRCDGREAHLISVDEITGEITDDVVPCICAETEKRECTPLSELRLLLPETGLGIWVLRTGSRVASTRLYDQVRFVETVAGGRMNHVPIRLVFAPKTISYFDEKEQKRRTTTKRVVDISVAGDAERALAAVGAEPNQALLAAVRTVLEETGHELGRGDEHQALPAGVEGEPSSREEAAEAGPSASAPTLDRDELIARAKIHVAGSEAMILREARKRWPNLASFKAISNEQLAELLEGKLGVS